MEPELLSFDDCRTSCGLFAEYKAGVSSNGIFVISDSHNEPYCFMWLRGGMLHRLYGPAYVSRRRVEWWLLGVPSYTKNQAEFEKWAHDNS